MLRLFENFIQSCCVEVVMSISGRIFDAAVALHQRSVFLERQISELVDLRNRLAHAQLRRSRSRSGRLVSSKLGRRRKCR